MLCYMNVRLELKFDEYCRIIALLGRDSILQRLAMPAESVDNASNQEYNCAVFYG